MDRRRWALAVPLALVAAYALLVDTVWIGGWAGTVDRVTGTTVLTGPVLAAVAAGIQASAARLQPVSEATPRGWWIPYRSAFAAWSVGIVVYVVTTAFAIGCTLAVPHGGPVQWWALVAGALVLALASLFGALVAHLLPGPVPVVAVGPVLFLLGAFGPAPLPQVLRFGPAGSMTGLQVDPVVYLARFAAIVAICLCLAVAMGPWRHSSRRVPLSVATVAAVFLAVAGSASVLLTSNGGDRLKPSDERATACAEGTPTVCVAPSHRRHLDSVRRAADAAAAVLVSAGVALPDRYEARFAASRPSQGSGSFYVDELSPELSFRDAVLLLARPADCPQWSSDEGPPYAAWDAEQLIAEWAVARRGGRPEAFSPEMERWIERIGDEATTRWVVRTFDLLKSCDFEGIVMPWE